MEARSLSALVDAYKAGGLTLPALLVDALGRRGTVTADQHAAELAWLARMREEGNLEAGVAQLLVERLDALQASAGEAEDVATVVKVERPALAIAGSDEATCVMPAARAEPAVPPPDQATVVKPAFVPAPVTAQTGATVSQTAGSTGGVDTSDWRRVADAAGGDQATVGMLLKGRFLLEREIGRGGMGVVFLARDERKVEARDRNPHVAVKVLNDEFRRHPDSLIALQRESRRSQSLAHDNIVRVFDFDKDRTIVFMTMEYVDGSDLKTLIRESAYNGLPLAKARPLIEGMARALKRAHDAGVVHSDFKPGNVMVTRDGIPKVFDFGIARAGKQADEPAEDQTVFDAGKLGALTPAYASLEMIEGKPPQPTDDIYALGCVAFELLTGKHPFDKASAEVALRERRRPPVVPGLTGRQQRTLCDAVAFTADKRLKCADLLVEGLRDVGLGERIGRPLAWALGGLLLLAVAGWGVFGQLRARHVAEVAARFQPDNPQRYGNEGEAVAALAQLGEDERKQLMLGQGERVQRFLLDRVDAYWDPAKGRIDYAGAQRVFALPAQLHLFLPRLDLRHAAVDEEKLQLGQAKVRAASAPTPARAGTVAAQPAFARVDPPRAPGRAPATSASEKPAAPPPSPASPANRMEEVAAGLLREGERNYRQQNYSAAIANAQAALQVSPGDPAAKRLLRRAQQAQQQAMSSISIN
ncbi:protein kinase domain-containing protein [Frateuria terrea]|uniref:Protein kinase domain-containing protein n=1 Tax=Frateuria terrea TaxID=529704 RepID=A0A1H6QMJ7_9GAMM|nr:protein kinase [Frateuria terrea]SEI41397.1 Protein kinase domain-containing protein [Frateuria terrea]SFP06743.1 Protein kinase domain-containing protein [Frateuria terrea]